MKDQLSQLMDGELDDVAVSHLLFSLKSDQELAEDWQLYHLIGDSLRQDAPLSADFSSRFSERLAAEPVIFAPKAVNRRVSGFSRRYVAMSAAASVMAVAAVGWFAFNHGRQGGDTVAVAPMMAANDPALRQVAVSNGGYDAMQDYLVAHREFAGLQTAALTTAQMHKGH